MLKNLIRKSKAGSVKIFQFKVVKVNLESFSTNYLDKHMTDSAKTQK